MAGYGTRIVATAALFGAMTACASLQNHSSKDLFAKRVLRGIAERQVDERIVQARALLAQVNIAKEQLAAGQSLPPESQAWLTGLMAWSDMNPGDPRGAALLQAFADPKLKQPLAARKAAYQDVLAWVDGRRAALQHVLEARLAAQTVQSDHDFEVCVDGVRRQYREEASGRFSRQADKPGPCEPSKGTER